MASPIIASRMPDAALISAMSLRAISGTTDATSGRTSSAMPVRVRSTPPVAGSVPVSATACVAGAREMRQDDSRDAPPTAPSSSSAVRTAGAGLQATGSSDDTTSWCASKVSNGRDSR